MKARHILTILLALVYATALPARDRLTFLDWNILGRDTLCPVYSESVPLETDHTCHTYQVRIEYPTWAPLSEAEAALAGRYASEIRDTLCISHYVSVSRGRACLNYSFIPIIRQRGGYRKLVSAKILIIPSPLAANTRATMPQRSSGRYASSSVLATGTWKKIYITKDGIYSLTPRFLASMGFRDPSKVHLYGYGGHQQAEALDAEKDFDDLEEVPLYKTADGNLLFWGNGVLHWNGTERVFNAYATKAAYFLTEGAVRQNIQSEPVYEGSVRQTVTTTLAHALHEVDDYAWFRSGRNLVESTLFSGAYSKTYTLSGINSIGNEKLTVVFTGSEVSTPLTVWVNGGIVLTKTLSAPGDYMYYTEGRYPNVDVSEYSAGNTWKITVATQGPFSTSSRVQARLDYIALNYTAPLELQNGFVRFGGGYKGTGSGTGSSSLVLSAFSGPTRFSAIGGSSASGIQIMRLGSRGNPARLVPTEQDAEGFTFATEDGLRDYVAFSPAYSFPEPEAGETVPNQNLHAMDSLDMVIIVPASGKLTAQAERLAQAHAQYSSLSCAVVRADHIYNEFSSGTPDVTAYRRFMKMLYDRGLPSGTAPRYLLLMGDCAWDNRMKSDAWRNTSPKDYLLCYQSENSYSDTQSYCWEDYFGLMDDGEGTRPTRDVSDLGIGRFPVTTEAQARVMVDKTIAHLRRDNAAEWCNKVVVLGDDGDNNIHMRDANRVADIISEEAPDVNLGRIMWDNYVRLNQGLYYSYPEVRSVIDKQMKDGVMYMNYTGHGSTYLLSHERVITLDDMRAWKSNSLPLWFVAACDVAPFDSREENLGEVAVLNEGGTAVAFIGTVHTVYSTQNYYLNSFFTRHLFSRGDDGRLNSVGDALRLAKSSIVSSNSDGSQPQNKLQYALLGDPALMFGNPQAKVVLDSINGKPVDGTLSLSSASRVRLSGHVERQKGEIDRTFKGQLYYRLFDSRNVVTTKGNAGDDPFTYTDWTQELNYGTDSIVDGCFSATTIIPRDIQFSNENGRIVFYAVNSDHSVEANGHNEDFLVGGYSSEMETDTVGPEIYMYLNDKDFADGDAVGPSPVFVAELSDMSGIQFNGAGIGHDLQLCIDGRTDMTYNLNSYYTQVMGDYSRGNVYFTGISDLAPGAHSLTFRAWDMMNNTTLKTMKFVVGENLSPEVLSLMLEQDVVSGHTNFHIGYNFPGLECTFTLEIFSISGALQWRSSVTTSSDNGIVTIPWEGCNGDGASVNDGIYICRVTASYDGGKKSHKEKKFIMQGNK